MLSFDSTQIRRAAVAALAILGLASSASAQSAADVAGLGDGYGLYEWGLVTYHADGAEIHTSNYEYRPEPPVAVEPQPVRPDRPIQTRKPILYLIPGPDFDEQTSIDVTIAIPGGSLFEIWPESAPGGSTGSTTHEWSDVTITQTNCSGATTGPTLESAHCQAYLGGICEAAEITEYIGETNQCLRVGNTFAPILLYNGYPPVTTSPIELDDDTMTLRNTTDHPLGPVYVAFGRQFYRVDSVPSGESVSVAELTPDFHFAETDGDIPSRIREDVLARGLPDAQAGEFMAAWSPDVLAAPMSWRAFGFFSRDYVDETYQLSAEPAPSEIERVIAFVVE